MNDLVSTHFRNLSIPAIEYHGNQTPPGAVALENDTALESRPLGWLLDQYVEEFFSKTSLDWDYLYALHQQLRHRLIPELTITDMFRWKEIREHAKLSSPVIHLGPAPVDGVG